MMNALDERTFRKVIGMFSPATNDFLSDDTIPKEDVVKGPNDRGLIGFDTFFPIKWLMEDYHFTEEEARHFVDLVHGKKEIE